MSSVQCHLSTIVMIITLQFEDNCHNRMHCHVHIIVCLKVCKSWLKCHVSWFLIKPCCHRGLLQGDVFTAIGNFCSSWRVIAKPTLLITFVEFEGLCTYLAQTIKCPQLHLTTAETSSWWDQITSKYDNKSIAANSKLVRSRFAYLILSY